MKYTNFSILILVAIAIFSSCKKDDDNGVIIVPPRDLAEVAQENNDSIVQYLETHFYNYEEFETPPMDFDYLIVLDTIAGANAGKTPLIDQITSRVITISDDDNDVEHTLYYLIAREGGGDNPTVADSTFVRYKGNLLDGSLFDSRNVPFWFDLLTVVRGVREVMPEFKTAGNLVDNGDGTFTFDNYGVGLVIMPSGLAYFNNPPLGIPAYSPLIFRIDLLELNDADHDNDGILSIDEDEDGDGNPLNDNTDGDNFPNCFDADDDGDGTLTRNEYDEDGNGTPDDSDGDGTPDYLDNN